MDPSGILLQSTNIGALAVFRQNLFIAEGSTLGYRTLIPDKTVEGDKDDSEKLIIAALEIFPRYKHICYIKFNEIGLRKGIPLVFVGTRSEGKIFKVFETEHGIIFKEFYQIIKFWVIAAQWLKSVSGTLFLTITDSNVAILWSLNEEAIPALIKINEYTCNKGQVVAAAIHGDELNKLILFSGTFSSDIIVWTISFDKAKFLYRLSGHMGLIFGLNFYPEDGLLLSTSDDRSVISWKFVNQNNRDYALTSAIQHGTANFQLQFKCFGHTGRVLHAVYVNEKIFSCGEDEFACVWDMSGKLMEKWEAHRGSTVCSCTVDPLSGIVCTGAKNGSVAQWSLEVRTPNPKKLSLEFNGSHFLNVQSSPYPKIIRLYDHIHTIVLMSNGSLLVTKPGCQQAKLLFARPGSVSRYQFCLSKNKDYLIYTNGCILFFIKLHLEDMDGEIQLSTSGPAVEVDVGTPILGLFPISKLRVFISGRDSHIVLTMFPKFGTSKPVLQTVRWSCPIPYITVIAEDPNGVLFIGDKKGRIHQIFPELWIHEFTHPTSHGRNGVTCILDIDDILVKCVISCGRDGCIRRSECNSSAEWKANNVNQLPFDWIDSMHTYGSDLILIGFQSTKACIYSSRQRTTLFRIECGGGHRSSNFYISPEGTASFAFIRNKQVYQLKFDIKKQYKAFTKGTHIATINCAIHIPWDHLNLGTFIVTGGEDNSIHISVFNCMSYVIQEELHVHNSSVRSLAYVGSGSVDSGFLISGGGRSQLSLTFIQSMPHHLITRELVTIDVRLYENDRYPTSDVRIMEVSSRWAADGRNFSDPSLLLVFVACSDGRVKVFETKGEKKELSLRSILLSNDECSLTEAKSWAIMRMCVVEQLPCPVFTIFGVSSNGSLYVWKYSVYGQDTTMAKNDEAKPDNIENGVSESAASVFPLGHFPLVHECAITALQVHLPDENSDTENKSVLVVITGGDDGIIKVHKVVMGLSDCKITLMWAISNIHRSTIMSIRIKFNRARSRHELFVSSVDQVLTKWDLDGYNGQLLLETTTGITDCQSILALSSNIVCCFGDGLSILLLDKFKGFW